MCTRVLEYVLQYVHRFWHLALGNSIPFCTNPGCANGNEHVNALKTRSLNGCRSAGSESQSPIARLSSPRSVRSRRATWRAYAAAAAEQTNDNKNERLPYRYLLFGQVGNGNLKTGIATPIRKTHTMTIPVLSLSVHPCLSLVATLAGPERMQSTFCCVR